MVGLGSIGTRHLKNIIEIGYANISIVSRKEYLTDEFNKLKKYSTIQEATLSDHFDTAIICTPTSKHVSDVKQLIQGHIQNIYIEKPVSNTLDEINQLLKLSIASKTKIVVGYDLHFDPGLQKVKQVLKENAIGKILSINAIAGQYLPDWRPNQDYTKGMSAKKNSGGGVMLDLVHEFDYLYWLLGKADTIAAHYMHSAALNIETEDVAEVLLKFKNGALATIHLDYLQPQLVRNCLVTGSSGSIFWDLSANNVRWVNQQKQSFEYSYKEFQRNDRFKAIMKAFLDGMQDDRLTSLQEGIESLKMVLAAKRSSENQVFVQMDKFPA